MSAPISLRLTACAKINVGLDILARRDDGFHEIDTLLVPISLADTLTIAVADRERFSCSDPGLPLDEHNLVVRALRLFQQTTGSDRNFAIHLEKRVPAGAGLGGGSSDAAATLNGLNTLGAESLSGEELSRLAAQLGSDVPFFLRSESCRAGGRGEILKPWPFPALHGLVVFPGFSISTADAYRAVDFSLTSASRFGNLNGFEIRGIDWQLWRDTISNDFEPVIFPQYPQLAEWKRRLYATGAGYAALSGSGSALFALFATAQTRDEAQKAVADQGQVFAIST